MKNNKKQILLYTRPLTPPWDEASKNLAYDIALNSDGTFNFHLLTTKAHAISIEKCHLAKKGSLTAEPIFDSPVFDKKAKITLIKRLFHLNTKADIIHFLFTPRSLTSIFFRARLACSNIKTIQTLATIDDKIIKEGKKLRKILFADKIIAQSNVTKNKLTKAGIKNVEVIYPGINLERFFPKEKNPKMLKELGIQENEMVILFAGEYTRLKAIDDIIAAFEKLLKENKKEMHNVKLVLACRIKYPEDAMKQKKLKKIAEKKGYLKKMVFLETVSNMPRLFNVSDINIFPVQEMAGKFDIPLAIIEAMACKKSMIVSDIDVLKEFVKNEETGLVIKKGDREQLADAILDLLKNKEKREFLAINAKKYVHSTFDIKNVVKHYKKVYTELVKKV